MKKEDKEFIEQHLHELKIAVDILSEGVQESGWKKLQLVGQGAYLANVYSGYESIMRTLLHVEGIEIPKGEHWHINLLRAAKSRDLITNEMFETLEDMLNFRNFHVYDYSYKLQEKEVRARSSEAINTYPIFEKHIREIIIKKNS